MQPIRITKTFFERMETRSGKDYSWIRPLTQPVSELMKYVDDKSSGDVLVLSTNEMYFLDVADRT